MNPDHALIHDFLRGDGTPRSVATSALAALLATELIAADAITGTVRLAFEPGPSMLQGRGVVQGGIIAAMLDFALGFAVFTRLPLERSQATASLTVNLLAPSRPGRYFAQGRIDRLGGRVAYSTATLTQGTDEATLIATASSVAVVIAADRS